MNGRGLVFCRSALAEVDLRRTIDSCVSVVGITKRHPLADLTLVSAGDPPQNTPMGIALRTTASNRSSLDMLGATTSMACAIHCAVVAFLLGTLPAASALAAPWIEWAFLASSLCIGVISLLPGYRHHRRALPLMLFIAGMVLLVSLRALRIAPSPGEMLVVLVAATCLVSAHWRNRTALTRCGCAAATHV
jgi:MerC mercury resistance protein